MKRKYIQEQWASYRDRIIPKDASRIQLVESRRCFFAGAAALYGIVVNQVSPDEEVQEQDLQLMQDIHDELLEFPKDVREGRA